MSPLPQLLPLGVEVYGEVTKTDLAWGFAVFSYLHIDGLLPQLAPLKVLWVLLENVGVSGKPQNRNQCSSQLNNSEEGMALDQYAPLKNMPKAEQLFDKY